MSLTSSVTSMVWDETTQARVRHALRGEEDAGLVFALGARTLALIVVGAWLIIEVPMPRASYYLGIIGLFLLLGAAHYVTRTRTDHPTAWTALFIALDSALLAVALIFPNPLSDAPWPIQGNLKIHNDLYLYIWLALAAISYSPILVIWTGITTMVAWSLAVWWVISLPSTITETNQHLATAADPLWVDQNFGLIFDPYFVSITGWANQVVLFLIATSLVAAAVWRSRKLLIRQARAERARGNLARFFSPNVVEQLADSDDALAEVRTQEVAVLFIDLVGFTRFAETLEPVAVIELLRTFHQRTAKVIFEHGGTIDKYLGDGIMATFGTPTPGAKDALAALHCACALRDTLDAWNREREAAGEPTLRAGMGLHFGPVVVGAVGDSRCLEFTVIGDSVNVASRLERLTRQRNRSIIVSGAAIEMAEAQAESDTEKALVKRFDRIEDAELRGRSARMPVWSPHAAGEAALPETAPTTTTD